MNTKEQFSENNQPHEEGERLTPNPEEIDHTIAAIDQRINTIKENNFELEKAKEESASKLKKIKEDDETRKTLNELVEQHREAYVEERLSENDADPDDEHTALKLYQRMVKSPVETQEEQIVTPEPKKNKFFSWLRNPFKKAAVVTSLTLSGMAAHSETTKVDSGPNDSTKNKIEVTKNTPEDSLKLNKNTATFKTKFSSDSLESVSIKKSFEENDTKETFGDITLEGNIYIPQSDTTKEVYAYYFSGGENNEHKIGSIIEIMKKKGLVPADGKLLREVYDQNKNNSTFKNKTAWLLAPTPEGAVDDSRANQKVIATHTEKGSVNKIVESTKEFDIIEKVPITVSTVEVVIPEHAVFPTKNPQGIGKFEVDKNVPTDGYGYLFVKPIPIPENK